MKTRFRYFLLSAVLLSAIVNASAVKESIKTEAMVHYEQGLRFKEVGWLDAALKEIKQAIKVSPGYTEAHIAYMDLMRVTGREHDLKKEYTKKAQKETRRPAFHYLYGRSLDESDLEGKEKAYRKAVEIDPDYFWGHLGLGEVYFRKGMIEPSITEYKKAIGIDSSKSSAHYALGLVYEKKGQPDDALAEYSKAVYLSPGHAQAHERLGYLYRNKGMLNEANAEFKVAHYQYGLYYGREKRVEEAISEIKKALEIDDRFTQAHAHLAYLYAQKNMKQEALAEYKEVLELDPDHIFDMGSKLIRNPTAVSMPIPSYTEAARRHGISGTVVLELVIKKNSSVTNLKMVRGLGYGLDEAAIEAVKSWRFEPGSIDGQVVNVTAIVEVDYKLK